MSAALSANTKAILLLTAPLIAGRAKKSGDLLTPGEYKKLARHLVELGAKPADLLTPAADQLLGDCHCVIDKARLERLLARGFQLSQAVERWQARAIWVVSRADSTYPQRLKARLKEGSPALLYGCGEREILESGGLAVVGSRHVDEALTEYTQEIGRLAASARRTLVSGGARGIDQAAMRGALESGGRVVGVLADGLERASMNREHRGWLLEGELTLISPYDPSAGFNVGHAMQRNKLIYALADAALVVSSDVGKGGTWAGATEQLERLRFVPVYVRSSGAGSKGLDALKKKGALSWPDPIDSEGMGTLLDDAALRGAPGPRQDRLSFDDQPAGEGDLESKADVVADVRDTQSARSPAEELFAAARSSILRLAQEPRKPAEIARELEVAQRQVEQWLKRLVAEGLLEKRAKPVRYVVRQGDLFDGKNPDGEQGSGGKD